MRAVNAVTISALFVIAFAVYRAATSLPPSFLDSHFGASYLPILLSGILALLTVALAIEVVLVDGGTSEGFARENLRDAKYPLAVGSLLAFFIVTLDMHWLPFVYAATLFAFSVAVFLSAERNLKSILVSGAVAGCSVALIQFTFTQVFAVVLP